jgi:hypothetical protein
MCVVVSSCGGTSVTLPRRKGPVTGPQPRLPVRLGFPFWPSAAGPGEDAATKGPLAYFGRPSLSWCAHDHHDECQPARLSCRRGSAAAAARLARAWAFGHEGHSGAAGRPSGNHPASNKPPESVIANQRTFIGSRPARCSAVASPSRTMASSTSIVRPCASMIGSTSGYLRRTKMHCFFGFW